MKNGGFAKRLGTLATAITREVEQTMFAAGELIATSAQISITEGAVSGKGHVASAPGEAPNNDSATLANGIEVRQTGQLTVEIASTAPYSADLEFGNSKLAARPFMAPAAERERARVNQMIGKAARRAARDHFRRQ